MEIIFKNQEILKTQRQKNKKINLLTNNLRKILIVA